jgi:hypothetical protein
MRIRSIDRILVLPVALLFLAYVLYRAIALDITYDEAWTILDLVPNSLGDVLSCIPCDANNHLLNTLLIKIIHTPGWRTTFLARLPNVLAFLIYLYHAWKIGRIFTTGLLSFAIFFALLANPFLLDFFSLARGYGMGQAFQLASIYWLLKFARDRHPRQAHVAMALASIGALAMLTQLYHVLALYFLCGLLAVRGERDPARVVIGNTLILMVLAGILFTPVRNQLAIDAFYHGGTTGVFHDTLLSLARYTLYDRFTEDVIRPFVAGFMLLVAGLAGHALFRRRALASPTVVVALMLVLCITGMIVQHHLLNTRYVFDRGALFLYPLIILTLLFGTIELPWKRAVTFIVSGILAFTGANLLMNANHDRTVQWSYDAFTSQALERIERMGAAQGRVLKVDHSWPFRTSIRYHLHKQDFEHLVLVDPTRDPLTDPSSVDVYLYLDHPLDKAPYDPDNEPVDAGRSDTLLSWDNGTHLLTGIQWRGRHLSSPHQQ